jgi:SAM-dependent methyltransferase
LRMIIPNGLIPMTPDSGSMAVVFGHEGPRLAAIARLAARAPAGPSLDVGVGYGYSSAALRAAGRERIIGVEHPSRAFVDGVAWRRIVSELELRPVLGDARRLPFRDASFSLVCAAEILEHIPPQECHAFLAACRRVLVAGGLVIVTTPNFVRLTNRLALLRGRSPLDLPVPRHGATFGHLREYTESELRVLLAHAQFEVREVACLSGHPTGRVLSRPWWLSGLEWALPHLGLTGVARYLVVGAVAR